MRPDAKILVVHKTLDVFSFDHKSPEFKKINRDGIIPYLEQYETMEDLSSSANSVKMMESASMLRYLCRAHPVELGSFYGLDQSGTHYSSVKHLQQIDQYLDFNATSIRPAFMGAFVQLMTALYNRTTVLTPIQQAKFDDAVNKQIPIMFKRFERMIETTNPDGEYLTGIRCRESGRNIPSIADIQLLFEVIDLEYLDDNQLG